MSLPREAISETVRRVNEFIDSTLSTASKILESNKDEANICNYEALEKLADTLSKRYENLKVSRAHAELTSCSSKSEAALDDIVLACQGIADDLAVRDQLLRPRRTGGTNQPGRWPKESLDALLQRLTALKSELETSVLPGIG